MFGSHPKSGRRDASDAFDLGATRLARKPSSKTLTAKKPKIKVEVVIDVRKKPRRDVARETSRPQVVR